MSVHRRDNGIALGSFPDESLLLTKPPLFFFFFYCFVFKNTSGCNFFFETILTNESGFLDLCWDDLFPLNFRSH